MLFKTLPRVEQLVTDILSKVGVAEPFVVYLRRGLATDPVRVRKSQIPDFAQCFRGMLSSRNLGSPSEQGVVLVGDNEDGLMSIRKDMEAMGVRPERIVTSEGPLIHTEHSADKDGFLRVLVDWELLVRVPRRIVTSSSTFSATAIAVSTVPPVIVAGADDRCRAVELDGVQRH